jgi:hypothetical protein
VFASISRNRNGNVIAAVLALIGVTGIAVVLSQLSLIRGTVVFQKIRSTRQAANLESGIETLLLAYRMEEIRYIRAIAAIPSCATARPFYEALSEGSGCPGATNIRLFSSANSDTILPDAADFYSFGAVGCSIAPNSSDCASGSQSLVTMSGPTQGIDGTNFEFSLVNVDPKKQLLEWLSISSVAGAKPLKVSFAIRASLTNSVHVEGDGRVTQENPDPSSICKGSPWATYFLFDDSLKRCTSFVELGSGTGLGFYGDRYFGFRPADGSVIDMSAVSSGATSYFVEEDGKLGGVSLFPTHSRTLLMNADDLTTVSDQLYYVAGVGDNAHIGLHKGASNLRVCELGAQGWAQSYVGIGALSWSEPLALSPTSTAPSMATFFLKTDGGDFLTAVVIDTAGILSCYVFKDSNLQPVEYRRTLGFDRAGLSKPYYVY